MYIFQHAQRKNSIFFTENVFEDSVRSVIEDSILAMHWVAPNATTRGVVQLLRDYS